MMSWWNEIFSKRAEVKPTGREVQSANVVLYAKAPIVTIASTSANAVIDELTVQFTREFKAKADKLNITLD